MCINACYAQPTRARCQLLPLMPAGQAKAAVSSEPTMMSQEARNLFLNGDKDSGLAAWKVRWFCVK